MIDFERVVHAEVAKMKQDEYAKKPIRTLGEVILLLQAQPKENLVKLDFTDDKVEAIDSYRGYYEDIALEYGPESRFSYRGPLTTVKELLDECERAVGKTFYGYKGDEYIMHRKTLVWVSRWGHCDQRMVTDIRSDGNITTIITEKDY